MRRVVILRPEPGASATFARATEQGLHAVKLPLFEIERLDWLPPSDISLFDGLLVSSANAIREAGEQLEQLKPLPVYVVGPATAEVAREAGFDVVQTGSAGLDCLAKSIEPGLRLLHLAGEDRIDPGAVRQAIIVLPVYRARMAEGLDAAPVGGSVVMVHSARAGARLAEIAPERSSIAIAAISRAAAESCGTGWQEVALAAEPTDRALLALAARLCEKSGE